MASRQHSQSPLPSYSRRPAANERTVAISPDFPLAIEAIQVVQEWFPGTSAGDAWEFIQQLAHLVRADVRSRQGDTSPENSANSRHTQERPDEGGPPSNVPEDSLMPDAA